MYLPMLGLILIVGGSAAPPVKVEPQGAGRGARRSFSWPPRRHPCARRSVERPGLALAGHGAQIARQVPRRTSNWPSPTTSRGAIDLAVAEFEKTASRGTSRLRPAGGLGPRLRRTEPARKALEKLRAGRRHGTHGAHLLADRLWSTPSSAAWKEAMEAFDTAQKLDPNFAITYMYKGQVRLATGRSRGCRGRIPARPRTRPLTCRRAAGTRAWPSSS